MRPARSLSLVTSLLLSACAAGSGDGDGGDGDRGGGGGGGGGGDPPIEATLESIQENVFSAVCTNCHVGAAAPQGLRLEEGMSHAMLVNVPSTEVPSILRVNPGNPDDSYLIQKIEGTASVGEQMPLGGPELSAEQIAAIRQWITDGATETTAARSRVAAARLRLLNPVPDADIRPADAPPVAELLVAADQALDVTLLSANTVTLLASGGDGRFGDGNEVAIAHHIVVTLHDPSVFRLIPLQPLAADRYRLRVSGSEPLAVADLAARSIDGDGDGRAGEDFVADFSAGTRR
jgi:hypothetical protein